MNVKEAYQFDLTTKEYLGICLVSKNPFGDDYLLPSDTVEIAPPEYGQYQKPVWNESTNTWNIIPDYRKAKVYSTASETLGQEVKLNLGEDLGTDKTLIEPLKPQLPYQKLSWNGLNWELVNDSNLAIEILRQTRDNLILETDWLVLRHRDEIDRGVTTTLTAEQYNELLNYRQALRDLPETVIDIFNPAYPNKPEFI